MKACCKRTLGPLVVIDKVKACIISNVANGKRPGIQVLIVTDDKDPVVIKCDRVTIEE